MKAVVVACLEPQHLDLCLDALLRWLPAEDVLVLDNGNTPERVEEIERTALRWSVATGRVHDHLGGEDTIPYIHEGLKEVCAMWPGEVVLKLDEDVLLVTRPERLAPGPRELLVPGVTVNNLTSRFFLRHLDPGLADLAASHPWLWHRPHPVTGEDTRERALKAIYTADPRDLVALCEREGGVERLGPEAWATHALMDASDEDERRGVSSTVMAFRADDYVELCGEGPGIEEVLLAEAVHDGRATYVVDTRVACHHVNYFSMRPHVEELGDTVEAWNRRAVVAMTAATYGLAA